MAELNENIAKIEKGSALEKVYNRLLSGFQTAQDQELPDFTSDAFVKQSKDSDGVVTYTADEDKINNYVKNYRDISLKNSAYIFASSIAGDNGTSGGGGTSGGDHNVFVAISGDTMTGKLITPYGFSAGDNGSVFLKVYQTNEDDASLRTNIVRIDGQLHLPTKGLYVNEKNVLFDDNDKLTLEEQDIELKGIVNVPDSLTVAGITINKEGIQFSDGKEYYHSGNSNREDVDWTMRNGTVAGDLLVKGKSALQGMVTATGGISLGYGEVALLTIADETSVGLRGNLNVLSGGIQFDGVYVIHKKNANVISFSAPNFIMNLGDDDTQKINLQSGIYDDDGEYELVGKFGDGYFPNSFRAGHHLGNVLFETYKNDDSDAGVIADRYLRFSNYRGPGFHSDDGLSLSFYGAHQYNEGSSENQKQVVQWLNTTFGYDTSISLFAPQNKKSASLFFTTDADFYVFDKGVESKNSLGISNSKTRLLANQLFFGDSVYWQGLADGVKYYGNAYLSDSIGSVTFSSGFAGSGWKIYQNQLTGNISATFDELTIRKKMRIYELEVQKQSVTNGSLWVSDACSGDIVEEIA